MPIEPTDLDAATSQHEDGVTLSLSGGGYRAMVFHIGALWRLNEVGLLSRLKRISSVSGGSITAAYLGLRWKDLNFDAAGKAQNFSIVVDGLRKMADTSVDVGAVIGGIFLPGTISDRVAAAYDDVLFDGKKLADLPDDSDGKAPRFVINATNIQSAVLWRFSRRYMGDYRVGLVDAPDVTLATAVAASSAFPPILSPLTLPIHQAVRAVEGADLSHPPYTTSAVLSDGGVYDNLGLETVKRFSTLLVSDAGQQISPEEDPHHDWARHAVRILGVIDNQVRSLRKRQLIDAYDRGDHTGTYWGIRTRFADYKLPADPLDCLHRNPAPLAAIPTRLEKMPHDVQNRLMNWGYAICDAALRTHIDGPLQQKLGIQIIAPTGFPFPGAY
ncbi:putative esterase of the alpha-beta hydrolase superfamily [Bradyrhizobium oligotrophicum S58]|uniref:Putative esterase of the alpha-beta hydrolase superfamily n=1 Tax=Bradyrhizobium oligotrophicum S58 TaxID=1245469 RepID=M4Z3V9_9BRAD|nr:patatin-like phospholipase family protein [Bradyrhizobium oligotrophicum]BAM87794.1 putative esterase of the alpha-beta hydrolase superfamily [Bradyrhizobium oligotrophicum S58]